MASFYAALNSVLYKCKSADETVKLQLVKSFCLPQLSYSIGAMEFKSKALDEMSVCWNDAFRKIFHFSRFESVKELMLFCNQLDFKHIYDLARVKFLNSVCVRFNYGMLLYECLELQFHAISHLEIKYSCSVDGISLSYLRMKIAVHFASLVLS